MRARLRDFGFPLLVLVALIGSGYMGMSTRVPTPVPDYALQASAVYRLEIGAAGFIVAYLRAMAFFLALDGRGFVEFGARGLKAEQVVRADNEQDVTLTEQAELNESLEVDLKAVEARLKSVVENSKLLEKRLEILERQTIS